MEILNGSAPATSLGLAVVVVRGPENDSVPGSIRWISHDEFKIVVDAPLKFQERIEIVINYGTVNELRLPATVGMIKRESRSLLSVHGSFQHTLENKLVERVLAGGDVERRSQIRKSCDLWVSVRLHNNEQESKVQITNISTIGCCFMAEQEFAVDEWVTIVFHDSSQHTMSVPAVICRATPDSNKFNHGCSFSSNLGILAEECSQKTKVDWMQKVTELVNSLPNI